MIRVEENLIAAAKDGDRDALSTLLEQAHERLRRGLAGRIPRRHQGAFDELDVLQVTYVEAFLRVGQFNGSDSASFEAWIFT